MTTTIATSGIFSLARVAGAAVAGLALGADAASAEFRQISGIVTTAGGTIYACDPVGNQIREIPPAGPTTVVAGAADGSAGYIGDNLPAIGVRLDTPSGLVRDARTGALFFCDTNNHRIRYFVPGGRIYTLAGGGFDPGDTVARAQDARLDEPVGIAMDGNGRIYFAEQGTGRVRMVDPGGALTTLALLAPDQLGPLVANATGSRLWLGVGSDVRVVRPGQTPALEPGALLAQPGGIITGLAFDQVDRLYVARTSANPQGASDTHVESARLDTAGALLERQTIAGTGGTSADEDDFKAPAVELPDARTQLLAGAGSCALYIDLHHASDPAILSGHLYLGNTWRAADGSTSWGQVLRLTPEP